MKDYAQFQAARRALLSEASRRCETGEVDHYGECMACLAFSGERCAAPAKITGERE